MSVICAKAQCGRKIKFKEKTMKCMWCAKEFHLGCTQLLVGLNESEKNGAMKLLQDQKQLSFNKLYLCGICETGEAVPIMERLLKDHEELKKSVAMIEVLKNLVKDLLTKHKMTDEIREIDEMWDLRKCEAKMTTSNVTEKYDDNENAILEMDMFEKYGEKSMKNEIETNTMDRNVEIGASGENDTRSLDENAKKKCKKKKKIKNLTATTEETQRNVNEDEMPLNDNDGDFDNDLATECSSGYCSTENIHANNRLVIKGKIHALNEVKNFLEKIDKAMFREIILEII